MKDCPHKSTQFAGSQGQSSSTGGKNQSMKNQPRPTSGQKGDKGRGKGKGKNKFGNPSSGGKNRPSARAVEGEEEEKPEYETERQENEETSEQPFDLQEEEQSYQEEQSEPVESTVKRYLHI